jgi:hypothetical protein
VGAQFICGNPNRRLRILSPSAGGTLLNGIDYLEVLDHLAPLGSPVQRTLLVRLFQPVPASLTAANLRLEGGVRIAGIGVEWAYRADLVPSPPATANEETFFAGLPARDHVLLVRTTSWGDYSRYRLSLQRSAVDPSPPDGFDPVLSSVEFSFKVECPSDFDCRPSDECPPAPAPAPTIDYLAKDYGTFRRVMLDRLSVTMPDWRERSPADVGVALVEVVAYAADHLSYFQDAVATEAYLGTARRRISVRRHARLLDYYVHEGANARTVACVEVAPTAPPTGVLLPAVDAALRHAAFLTRCTDGPRVNPADLDQLLLARQPLVFEPMHDLLLFSAHNQIRFYTWDDDQCCLPKGATRATLVDDPDPGKRLKLMPGDLIVFEEWLGRETGVPADADPARRQVVRLTAVAPAATTSVSAAGAPRTAGPLRTDILTGQAIVEIEWHQDDALAFPLCISTLVDGLPLPDPVSGASGNVVLIDHGRTIGSEALVPSVVTDPRTYRPRLALPEVTHGAPFDYVSSLPQSATATLVEDPHQSVPHVSMQTGSERWTARRDLLRSSPFARDFVVEVEEDGQAILRFGDGQLGHAPEDDLVATYRVGRGRAGNIGADSIVHVTTVEPTIQRVRNPLAATSGIDPEPLAQVVAFAPQAFRVQERAVTEADYAAMAERHDDVLKAVARRRWTGSWYTVFVTVERRGGRELDDAFKADLLALLERYRLAGEDLEIEQPIFVPLDLQLVVCVQSGYFREHVEQALLRAFSNQQFLDGTRGFFHPDNFTFGQPVYLSQVIGAAMQVPGVDWVDPEDPSFIFQRFGELPDQEIERGLISMAELEIARLDNSPSLPENGRLRLVFMGGQ